MEFRSDNSSLKLTQEPVGATPIGLHRIFSSNCSSSSIRASMNHAPWYRESCCRFAVQHSMDPSDPHCIPEPEAHLGMRSPASELVVKSPTTWWLLWSRTLGDSQVYTFRPTFWVKMCLSLHLTPPLSIFDGGE